MRRSRSGRGFSSSFRGSTRSGSSSDVTGFLSPQRNSRIGFGEACVYLEIRSSIDRTDKYLGITNLLKEEKGDEPGDDREGCRHGARQKVWIVLQEFVVTEQFGESRRRTRECSSNNGPIPGPKSFNDLKQDKGVRVTHPMVAPVDQAIGWYDRAKERFVGSVISAMLLLITPMLPLSAPFMARLGSR